MRSRNCSNQASRGRLECLHGPRSAGFSVIGGLFLRGSRDNPLLPACCRRRGQCLDCAKRHFRGNPADDKAVFRASCKDWPAVRRARVLAETVTRGKVWLTRPLLPPITPPRGDVTKRDLLQLIAIAGAAIGAGAIAWPLINFMNPSKDVLALSSVEVDLTPVVEGQGITIVWQGKPIFVRHRTAGRNQGSAGRSARPVDRAAGRFGSGQGRPRPVDRPDRHLHPSGLRAAGQQAVRPARRLGRLVLPLPRQPVRHVRARAPWARAGEPGAAPLRIRIRHQDQGRLIHSAFRPATGK